MVMFFFSDIITFLFSSALYLIALRHRYDNIDIAIVMIHYWTTILGLLILIFSKLYGSFDKQADYISFDKDVRESVAIIVVVLTCVVTIQVAPIIIFVRKMF